MADTEHEVFGTVTLTLEDDSELECAILAIYPAGDSKYIALLPLAEDEDEDADDADVLIYRFIEGEDGEDPQLENIESDEEYDVAADAFDELLDEQEFDEEGGDDDDDDTVIHEVDITTE